MNILPIQITEEGVLIPRNYLHNDGEFEIEYQPEYIFIRPKTDAKPAQDVRERFPWIGIGVSSDPTASQRVEEILLEEVDLRSGFTFKSSPLLPSESTRFSFVGIGLSRNPNASEEVEKILEQG